MKTIDEQKKEKALAICDLLTEHFKCLSIYMNEELPLPERLQAALRCIIITDVDLPLLISKPLQAKEYPKGGIIAESGPELIFQAKESGNFTVFMMSGDKIVRP